MIFVENIFNRLVNELILTSNIVIFHIFFNIINNFSNFFRWKSRGALSSWARFAWDVWKDGLPVDDSDADSVQRRGMVPL